MDISATLLIFSSNRFLTPSVAAASIDNTLCIHPREINITNKGLKSSQLHTNPIPLASTTNATSTGTAHKQRLGMQLN
eukprot:7345714-Ditylum_brightwellii.AAC.1